MSVAPTTQPMAGGDSTETRNASCYSDATLAAGARSASRAAAESAKGSIELVPKPNRTKPRIVIGTLAETAITPTPIAAVLRKASAIGVWATRAARVG